MAKKLKHFGVHLTIDGYSGDRKRLNDMGLIFSALNDLPKELKMHKLCPPYVVCAPANNKKDPGGFSGFVMIAESHISVHTFPEKRFISIDIYTCQNRLPIERVKKFFKKTFKLKELETNYIIRGVKYSDF